MTHKVFKITIENRNDSFAFLTSKFWRERVADNDGRREAHGNSIVVAIGKKLLRDPGNNGTPSV